ncbi:hypothetical protein UA32_07660 [Photobacterium angustum]|uniref:dTDP-glucose 4,6-dehydratase n=2 Tax=Photobacterium angustum TaxID=661 RepID=A0ABX5GYF5_PHOAN|nr:hypothetical protein UA32_07660 [Photobacterium angustum]PSX01049.1 dTDP-glucose 4,6-dehydratase [Photobacterium angustum]
MQKNRQPFLDKIMNESDFDILVNQSQVDYSKLRNKTILVTGALGMLAANCIDLLLLLNKNRNYDIKIIALARSYNRLKDRFGEESLQLEYIVQDISDEITYNNNIDYIIHAAGNSSPYYIEKEPLNIIEANVIGSFNIVNLAKSNKNIENILFTSTREVYGKIEGVNSIKEDNIGIFDPLDKRSCYPESKRMSENIFKSASIQYGLKFNIARIAHSYGPGMSFNDGRVMADLLGDTINDRNIVLKSDGSALRSFCYVLDAVSAMFYILLNGKNEMAYNIANEDEDISIFELAQKIISLSNKNISVSRVTPDDNNLYCNYERVMLNTDKLRELGWKPHYNLNMGIKLTLSSRV